MERDRLPVVEYEKLAGQLQASPTLADEWARAAKLAGARYLNVTVKGPDGFCLFGSKLNRFNLVESSPGGRDLLADLARACKGQGLKLFVTYSLLDWHHTDYFPRGKTGRSGGRPDSGDWSRYLAYVKGQLAELCEGYGPLGGVWLEGWNDRPDAAWDLEAITTLIHRFQPEALVGLDYRVKDAPGRDVVLFEGDLPGVGFGPTPMEATLSIGKSRGFDALDRTLKTDVELIHSLLGAASQGANLAIELGPRQSGAISAEAIDRLRLVGKWLESNGSFVYGTRRGPIEPGPWGVSVLKGSTVVLHITKPALPVVVPRHAELSEFATLEGHPLETRPVIDGVRIEIPETARNPTDTILLIRPLIFAPTSIPRRLELPKR